MTQSKHYQLKKKYFELLAENPDYPAWQDFECIETVGGLGWARLTQPPVWFEDYTFRYNPIPKKWKPKEGWFIKKIAVCNSFTNEDLNRLQAYATKLSWLREHGGYSFIEIIRGNYFHYKDRGVSKVSDESFAPDDDIIYMNKEQSEKWHEMLKNGEV